MFWFLFGKNALIKKDDTSRFLKIKARVKESVWSTKTASHSHTTIVRLFNNKKDKKNPSDDKTTNPTSAHGMTSIIIRTRVLLYPRFRFKNIANVNLLKCYHLVFSSKIKKNIKHQKDWPYWNFRSYGNRRVGGLCK